MSGIYTQELATWKSDIGNVLDIAWSPDSKRLAGVGTQGVLVIWSALDGRVLQMLKGHTGSILHVAWNVDAKRILTAGNDNTIRVWDAISGKSLCVLPQQEHVPSPSGPLPEEIGFAKWSPDGKTIASAGYDGSTIELWNMTPFGCSSSPRIIQTNHPWGVRDISWNAVSTQFVSVGLLNVLPIWNAETGKILSEIECPLSQTPNKSCRFLYADWSPDGRYIFASGDNGYEPFTRIWDLETQTNRNVQPICTDICDWTSRWMPHSTALVSWSDNQIQVRDIINLERIGVTHLPLNSTNYPIGTLYAISPNEQFLVIVHQTEVKSIVELWGNLF